MELNEDIVVDIISRLPVRLAVQCKVLSNSFNNKLCEPNISQSFASRWFRDQNITNLLICSSSLPSPSPSPSPDEIFNFFRKVASNNPWLRRGQISRTSSLNVSLLASCKGLLLLEFHQFKTFCIFNPVTGLHQLIPYPEPKHYFSTMDAGVGLAVDHPNSNRYYKLVTVGMLNKLQGYRFRVFSSEEAGVVWREFQLRRRVYTGTSLVGPQPVYAHNCLHWLTSNGNILAFDTKSSTGQATIINHPEVLRHYFKDPTYGIICFMFDAVLGLAGGVLTLLCAFKKTIVIFGYDYASRNWTASYTLPNVSPDLVGRLGGPAFPILCFDGGKLFILGSSQAAQRPGYLYEYDSGMKTYKKVDEAFDMHNSIFFSWEPTLASIPKTELPPYTVHSKNFPAITATLDELRCLMANQPQVKRVAGQSETASPPSQGREKSQLCENLIFKGILFRRDQVHIMNVLITLLTGPGPKGRKYVINYTAGKSCRAAVFAAFADLSCGLELAMVVLGARVSRGSTVVG
ncbi:hypothetical protein T459_09916 [Capsicum annuum]|uniref:Uncharacterized protein n=1 Tax=Capsicum annuum TaxID=4072 RepID=A0A1U8G665_CAPAN|nr:hypothetical protein T459_09916 [Capsicum annuum]